MKNRNRQSNRSTRGRQGQSGSSFNRRDVDDVQRRPGHATGPCPPQGLTLPPLHQRRHSSRFRQDSTPKRGSERAGEANRKQPQTQSTGFLFCLFFWGGDRSCPNSFPHLQATCGDTMTIQTPALAFRLLEVRSHLLPKTPL